MDPSTCHWHSGVEHTSEHAHYCTHTSHTHTIRIIARVISLFSVQHCYFNYAHTHIYTYRCVTYHPRQTNSTNMWHMFVYDYLKAFPMFAG